MSVEPRRGVPNPEFTPPLPLPTPDESPVITEAAKRVSIDLNAQHSNTTQQHLKSLETGGGVFFNSGHSNPGNITSSSSSSSILKRRPLSERILEPHVVHIRKTETGETQHLSVKTWLKCQKV